MKRLIIFFVLGIVTIVLVTQHTAQANPPFSAATPTLTDGFSPTPTITPNAHILPLMNPCTGQPFTTIMTGIGLESVTASLGDMGNNQYVINFTLADNDEARRLSQFSATHIRQPMAVVLDGMVITAPTIQAELTTGGVITGNFTRETAEALAVQLRYGALPANLDVRSSELVGEKWHVILRVSAGSPASSEQVQQASKIMEQRMAALGLIDATITVDSTNQVFIDLPKMVTDVPGTIDTLKTPALLEFVDFSQPTSCTAAMPQVGQYIVTDVQQQIRLTGTQTMPPTITPVPTTVATVTSNAQWKSQVQVQNFSGVDMVLVPPGCFKMGSTVANDDASPINQQCFKQPFWIDKYLVTNAQFAQFKGQAAHPNNWTGDQRPRALINWFEATAYCALRGARLPTEAEWEYAARGPDALDYPWGNSFIGNNAIYSGNSFLFNQTADVGSTQRAAGASWVGAFDMAGNVWEWTSSLDKPYPYDSVKSESSTNTNNTRVLRGGSWFDDSSFLRSTYRYGYYPTLVGNNFGFRCARSYSAPALG